MKNIILYGAPAAGKGTMCELLVSRLGYKHISIGQVLRDQRSPETEIGRIIIETQDKGVLTPDNIVAEALKAELKKYEGQPVVLDGYPRNVNQANTLDTMFNNYIVINIEVTKEVALERTLGRRNCPKCGRIYNIYTSMKPKQDNICDDCGCELEGRSDDNEASFEVRFNTYLDNMKSVLGYYQEKNNLYIIKSQDSKEEIYADIKDILGV